MKQRHRSSLSASQRTYVERDVRTASDISSLQVFGRFLGLLAALTGQEVNHSQLGRELGIDRKTAVAWTEVATGLIVCAVERSRRVREDVIAIPWWEL